MVESKHSFSIRAKLAAAFGLSLGAVVAISIVGVNQLQTFRQFTTELSDAWLPELAAINNVRIAMTEFHQAAARQVDNAIHHTIPRHLEPEYSLLYPGIDQAEIMATLARRIESAISSFTDALDTEEEHRLLGEFLIAWGEYRSAQAEVTILVDNGKAEQAVNLFNRIAVDTYRNAHDKADEVFTFVASKGKAWAADANSLYRSYLLEAGLAIVLTAFAVIGALVWLTREVSRPLHEISGAMERLVAGDLTAEFVERSDRRDEIGSLIRAVQGYRKSLLSGLELAADAARERDRLEVAVSNLPVALAVFDRENRLVLCNPRYAAMYELPSRLAMTGVTLREICEHRIASGAITPEGAEARYEEVLGAVLAKKPIHAVRQWTDGRIVDVQVEPLDDGGWLTMQEDITDRRKIQEEIAFLYAHDPLTRLTNREAFKNQMGMALRRGAAFAVLCLDIDRLREITDAFGVGATDQILKGVAGRLTETCDSSSVLARFAGGEFAVLQLDAAGAGDAEALARRIMESLSRPFEVDGHEATVGASMGIAIAPGDGRDPDQLIQNSYTALHRAKGEGRGSYRFFEPGMDAAVSIRREIERGLRSALANREFELWYQPLIDLRTEQTLGFEALLRWRHPTRGLISPADFILIAEATGLIRPLGAWILQEACNFCARLPPPLRVAVNISAVDFHDAALIVNVRNALEQSGLPASRLELEITETAMLENTERTLAILQGLHALGARIVMDDFGTGYSSLGYLQMFPFDKIKIDRQFIDGVTTKRNSIAIVRAVISIAESMGITTLAEGVETEEQLNWLKAERCVEAQGFFIGHPRPAAEAFDFVSDAPQQAATAWHGRPRLTSSLKSV
ncbi:MAG: EAL domain-containing protein [Bauldia sp.]|nr:EAL domain-containing protein [Bauldia sp.]